MSNGIFLTKVQKKGLYDSKRDASRAANAVFGTIKSWITPAASDEMRKLLPGDASHIWQYSPTSFKSDPYPDWRNLEFPHLILKIQQAGQYDTSAEAQRAYGSVMEAVKATLPVSAELIIGKRARTESIDWGFPLKNEKAI